MGFERIQPSQRGRPAKEDSVTVRHGGAGALQFLISHDIAEKLGFTSRSRLAILQGSGRDQGFLMLTRTADDNGVFTYGVGRQVAINIRSQFLAIDEPTTTTKLPHRFVGQALVIDLRPLIPTTEATEHVYVGESHQPA